MTRRKETVLQIMYIKSIIYLKYKIAIYIIRKGKDMHYRTKYRRERKKSTPFIDITALGITAYYTIRMYGGNKIDPTIGKAIILITAVMIAIVFLMRTAIRYARRWKYLHSSISKIDAMKGEEFEKYLQAFFEKKGYRVSLTKKSGDFGADLVMHKNGHIDRRLKVSLPETTIVQVKRYNKNVGIEAVQQIMAAKSFYNADKCAVATNQYFTPAAQKLAAANDVVLWDRSYFWESKR